MSVPVQPQSCWLARTISHLIADTKGAQIVELAVTLPLLVVIFVGIYDFGQAFNMKQKLSTATREGARFAANQSTIDLTDLGGPCSASAPKSVCAALDVIDAYLVANNINDCGLSSPSSVTQTGWKWTFTGTSCPGGNLTLTIDRGAAFIAGGVTVEATSVQLSYPYQWHFNRVVQFLVPGASFGAVTQIPTTATMQNLN
jgi:Flp pilus assembly protein TadG